MLGALIALWGCNGADPSGKDGGPAPEPHVAPDPMVTVEPLPNTCDAGDAAWVARAMPLLWGRRPHGVAEVQYWAQMAGTYGREAVVRAMTEDREYLVWWADWFTDALYVARTGDKEFGECFAAPLLTGHDGSLTQFLRDYGPREAPYSRDFSMADVIVDGLVTDDVSAIYRAHLFARLKKPTTGANVSQEQLEYNRRVNYGELFYRTYVGRNLVCMNCHNSEFSTTDALDPDEDRTWQVPGKFERALLGEPTGRDQDEAYAIFRYDPLSGGFFGGGEAPWGWDAACGTVEGPSNLPARDMLDQQTAYFIRPYSDAEGSVYDVERDLAAGVEALRGKGLTVGANGEVDGQEGFAWLVASNLANQVWATATGADLTIAHMFPRNRGQMERMKALGDVLAASGFSMRELLVAVTLDPYFNPGLPSTCDAIPYGLDPIFDPWTGVSPDPHMQRNGPSDAVHRLPARALLRSAHINLDWKPRDIWFGMFGGGDEEVLQGALGVFLRESDPGHRGTDFQGLLSFETEFGACSEEPRGGADFVDGVIADALARQGTVGEVALALRDRLTSGTITAEEQPLVEDLLGRAFTDPVDSSPDLEARLRLFCGALLESPQFQLVTDDPIGSEVPRLARDVEADCERVADLMQKAGFTATCDGRRLEGDTPTSTTPTGTASTP